MIQDSVLKRVWRRNMALKILRQPEKWCVTENMFMSLCLALHLASPWQTSLLKRVIPWRLCWPIMTRLKICHTEYALATTILTLVSLRKKRLRLPSRCPRRVCSGITAHGSVMHCIWKCAVAWLSHKVRTVSVLSIKQDDRESRFYQFFWIIPF